MELGQAMAIGMLGGVGGAGLLWLVMEVMLPTNKRNYPDEKDWTCMTCR